MKPLRDEDMAPISQTRDEEELHGDSRRDAIRL